MLSERARNVKLIDRELDFRTEAFEDYLKETEFNNFLNLCIIGPQSGGKSSLLNKLLGESIFKVMDGSKAYNQTTLGIDAVAHNNWFVMDFEGSGSSEREEKDQESVQYKLGLFALIISDIILLNIFVHEIRRASPNYKILLEVIFGSYLKYYKLESQPKKLFIILRDCPLGTTPSTHEKTVLNGLNKIWNSIEKPEEILLENLFQVTIIAMHKEYDSVLDCEVNELRDLLRIYEQQDQVSTEEMPLLLEKLWTKIKAEEDLESILSVKQLMEASKCRRIVQICTSSSLQQLTEIEYRASYEFLNLEALKEQLILDIQEEILRKIQSVTENILEEQISEMRKEIENAFVSSLEAQRKLILSEIFKKTEELENQLLSNSFDSFSLIEFLEEARNSSAWDEPYHFAMLQGEVHSKLRGYFSEVRSHLGNSILHLQANNEDDLQELQLNMESEISRISELCNIILTNLETFVDVNDPDYRFDKYYSILSQRTQVIKLEIECSNLQNIREEAEANIKIEEERRNRAMQMTDEFKEDRERILAETTRNIQETNKMIADIDQSKIDLEIKIYEEEKQNEIDILNEQLKMDIDKRKYSEKELNDLVEKYNKSKEELDELKRQLSRKEKCIIF